MSPEVVGILGLIVMVALLLLRVQVGVAMIAVGLVGFTIIINRDAALARLASDTFRATTIQSLAVMAFKALDCAGLARCDFLLEKKSGEVFVNELNTMPGFTPISMYPKLWTASGLSYSELIDRLIELALERHEDKQQSRATFDVSTAE